MKKMAEKLKLYINTSSNKKTVIGLQDKKIEVSYAKPRDQEILQIIERLMNQQNLKPESIGQIQINPGPGSYTSLRAGFSIANTFAWALGIKINKKVTAFPIYE